MKTLLLIQTQGRGRWQGQDGGISSDEKGMEITGIALGGVQAAQDALQKTAARVAKGEDPVLETTETPNPIFGHSGTGPRGIGRGAHREVRRLPIPFSNSGLRLGFQRA